MATPFAYHEWGAGQEGCILLAAGWLPESAGHSCDCLVLIAAEIGGVFIRAVLVGPPSMGVVSDHPVHAWRRFVEGHPESRIMCAAALRMEACAVITRTRQKGKVNIRCSLVVLGNDIAGDHSDGISTVVLDATGNLGSQLPQEFAWETAVAPRMQLEGVGPGYAVTLVFSPSDQYPPGQCDSWQCAWTVYVGQLDRTDARRARWRRYSIKTPNPSLNTCCHLSCIQTDSTGRLVRLLAWQERLICVESDQLNAVESAEAVREFRRVAGSSQPEDRDQTESSRWKCIELLECVVEVSERSDVCSSSPRDTHAMLEVAWRSNVYSTKPTSSLVSVPTELIGSIEGDMWLAPVVSADGVGHVVLLSWPWHSRDDSISSNASQVAVASVEYLTLQQGTVALGSTALCTAGAEPRVAFPVVLSDATLMIAGLHGLSHFGCEAGAAELQKRLAQLLDLHDKPARLRQGNSLWRRLKSRLQSGGGSRVARVVPAGDARATLREAPFAVLPIHGATGAFVCASRYGAVALVADAPTLRSLSEPLQSQGAAVCVAFPSGLAEDSPYLHRPLTLLDHVVRNMNADAAVPFARMLRQISPALQFTESPAREAYRAFERLVEWHTSAARSGEGAPAHLAILQDFVEVLRRELRSRLGEAADGLADYSLAYLLRRSSSPASGVRLLDGATTASEVSAAVLAALADIRVPVVTLAKETSLVATVCCLVSEGRWVAEAKVGYSRVVHAVGTAVLCNCMDVCLFVAADRSLDLSAAFPLVPFTMSGCGSWHTITAPPLTALVVRRHPTVVASKKEWNAALVLAADLLALTSRDDLFVPLSLALFANIVTRRFHAAEGLLRLYPLHVSEYWAYVEAQIRGPRVSETAVEASGTVTTLPRLESYEWLLSGSLFAQLSHRRCLIRMLTSDEPMLLEVMAHGLYERRTRRFSKSCASAMAQVVSASQLALPVVAVLHCFTERMVAAHNNYSAALVQMHLASKLSSGGYAQGVWSPPSVSFPPAYVARASTCWQRLVSTVAEAQRAWVTATPYLPCGTQDLQRLHADIQTHGCDECQTLHPVVVAAFLCFRLLCLCTYSAQMQARVSAAVAGVRNRDLNSKRDGPVDAASVGAACAIALQGLHSLSHSAVPLIWLQDQCLTAVEGLLPYVAQSSSVAATALRVLEETGAERADDAITKQRYFALTDFVSSVGIASQVPPPLKSLLDNATRWRTLKGVTDDPQARISRLETNDGVRALLKLLPWKQSHHLSSRQFVVGSTWVEDLWPVESTPSELQVVYDTVSSANERGEAHAAIGAVATRLPEPLSFSLFQALGAHLAHSTTATETIASVTGSAQSRRTLPAHSLPVTSTEAALPEPVLTSTVRAEVGPGPRCGAQRPSKMTYESVAAMKQRRTTARTVTVTAGEVAGDLKLFQAGQCEAPAAASVAHPKDGMKVAQAHEAWEARLVAAPLHAVSVAFPPESVAWWEPDSTSQSHSKAADVASEAIERHCILRRTASCGDLVGSDSEDTATTVDVPGESRRIDVIDGHRGRLSAPGGRESRDPPPYSTGSHPGRSHAAMLRRRDRWQNRTRVVRSYSCSDIPDTVSSSSSSLVGAAEGCAPKAGCDCRCRKGYYPHRCGDRLRCCSRHRRCSHHRRSCWRQCRASWRHGWDAEFHCETKRVPSLGMAAAAASGSAAIDDGRQRVVRFPPLSPAVPITTTQAFRSESQRAEEAPKHTAPLLLTLAARSGPHRSATALAYDASSAVGRTRPPPLCVVPAVPPLLQLPQRRGNRVCLWQPPTNGARGVLGATAASLSRPDGLPARQAYDRGIGSLAPPPLPASSVFCKPMVLLELPQVTGSGHADRAGTPAASPAADALAFLGDPAALSHRVASVPAAAVRREVIQMEAFRLYTQLESELPCGWLQNEPYPVVANAAVSRTPASECVRVADDTTTESGVPLLTAEVPLPRDAAHPAPSTAAALTPTQRAAFRSYVDDLVRGAPYSMPSIPILTATPPPSATVPDIPAPVMPVPPSIMVASQQETSSLSGAMPLQAPLGVLSAAEAGEQFKQGGARGSDALFSATNGFNGTKTQAPHPAAPGLTATECASILNDAMEHRHHIVRLNDKLLHLQSKLAERIDVGTRNPDPFTAPALPALPLPVVAATSISASEVPFSCHVGPGHLSAHILAPKLPSSVEPAVASPLPVSWTPTTVAPATPQSHVMELSATPQLLTVPPPPVALPSPSPRPDVGSQAAVPVAVTDTALCMRHSMTELDRLGGALVSLCGTTDDMEKAICASQEAMRRYARCSGSPTLAVEQEAALQALRLKRVTLGQQLSDATVISEAQRGVRSPLGTRVPGTGGLVALWGTSNRDGGATAWVGRGTPPSTAAPVGTKPRNFISHAVSSTSAIDNGPLITSHPAAFCSPREISDEGRAFVSSTEERIAPSSGSAPKNVATATSSRFGEAHKWVVESWPLSHTPVAATSLPASSFAATCDLVAPPTLSAPATETVPVVLQSAEPFGIPRTPRGSGVSSSLHETQAETRRRGEAAVESVRHATEQSTDGGREQLSSPNSPTGTPQGLDSGGGDRRSRRDSSLPGRSVGLHISGKANRTRGGTWNPSQMVSLATWMTGSTPKRGKGAPGSNRLRAPLREQVLAHSLSPACRDRYKMYRATTKGHTPSKNNQQGLAHPSTAPHHAARDAEGLPRPSKTGTLLTTRKVDPQRARNVLTQIRELQAAFGLDTS